MKALTIYLTLIAFATQLHAEIDGVIAFIGYETMEDVYILQPDGTTAANITNSADLSDWWPMLAQNGRLLIYAAQGVGGVPDIFVTGLPPGEADPINVTANPVWNGYPSFSPDGSTFAYSSADSTGEVGLYWIGTGGKAGKIFDAPGHREIAPCWSPDGAQIAFVSSMGDTTGTYYNDIFIIPDEGAQPVNLTQSPDGDEEWPAWSPDGTAIAFTETGNLYVIPVGGPESTPTKITSTQSADGRISWSPDGSHLAFGSSLDGEIYVVKRDGTGLRKVSEIPGLYKKDVSWSVQPPQ